MIEKCNLCGFDVEVDPSDDAPYGYAHEKCRDILWINGRYKFTFAVMWEFAEDKYPKLIEFMLDVGVPDFILKDIEERKKSNKENRYTAS